MPLGHPHTELLGGVRDYRAAVCVEPVDGNIFKTRRSVSNTVSLADQCDEVARVIFAYTIS